MYDVIVVGARCAGASLAMLLARDGHSRRPGRSGLVSERHHVDAFPLATGWRSIAGVGVARSAAGARLRANPNDHLRRRRRDAARHRSPRRRGIGRLLSRVGPCSTLCWSKRPLSLEPSSSTASWSMDWCGPKAAWWEWRATPADRRKRFCGPGSSWARTVCTRPSPEQPVRVATRSTLLLLASSTPTGAG